MKGEETMSNSTKKKPKKAPHKQTKWRVGDVVSTPEEYRSLPPGTTLWWYQCAPGEEAHEEENWDKVEDFINLVRPRVIRMLPSEYDQRSDETEKDCGTKAGNKPSPKLGPVKVDGITVPLETQGQWLPIRTAPRDGTRILATSPGCGVHVHYWNSTAKQFWIDFAEGAAWAPTVWMPLPTNPDSAYSPIPTRKPRGNWTKEGPNRWSLGRFAAAQEHSEGTARFSTRDVHMLSNSINDAKLAAEEVLEEEWLELGKALGKETSK